jgi:hypothetical protein
MAELSHEQLWHVRQREPGDYVPYGKRKRLTARQIWGDCSCVCKWFHHTLSGAASLDWGVCAAIPRVTVGLLTFEHQGCAEI